MFNSLPCVVPSAAISTSLVRPLSSRRQIAARRGLSRLVQVAVLLCTCLLPVLGFSQQSGQVIQVANGDVTGLVSAIQTLNQTGGGTIVLAPGGVYNVTQASDWWYGPNAFPAITSNILIVGSGSTITRDANAPRFRFFYVSGGWEANTPKGTLTLADLTLQNGLAQGGNGGSGGGAGGGAAGLGGAIYNQGQLNLARVNFQGNTAQGGIPGGYNGSRGGGGGGGLGGNGGSSVNYALGPGGGGFKTNGQDSTNYEAGGGNFLGSEGGSGCSGGTSIFGGNGGGSSATYNGGGGGGGFLLGNNGSSDPNTYGGFGVGAIGGGNGGNGAPKWDGECSGAGGAFGGGGGGGGIGGGGGGGVGGGGGGGISQGGSGGFGGGGGGQGIDGGGPGGSVFGGGGGNGTPGGFGSGSGSGAGMGGAVFNHWGTVQLGNVTFGQNTASGGTGAQGLGGGLFNLDGQVTLWNVGSSPFGTATTAKDIYNLADNAGNYASGQTPGAALAFVDVDSTNYDVANTQNSGTTTIQSAVKAQEFTLSGLKPGPGGATNAINFGNVALNQASTQNFTISSTGQLPGAITSIQLISSPGFSVGGSCNTLPCTLSVSFNPTAEGPMNAELLINDGAPDSPQVVYLNGTGGFPSLSASPNPATVSALLNQNATTQIVVTNTSAKDPLNISSVQISNATSIFTQANNCTAGSIAPGANCTIAVTYQANTAAGGSATITLTDNAADSPQTLIVNGQTIKLDQQITITTSAPASALFGTSFNVAATSTSGLPVSITGSGACSASGTGPATLTMTSGTGTCWVIYSQAGSATYNPAPTITQAVAALPSNFTLLVTEAGTGSGTVSSTPGVINCTETSGTTTGVCTDTYQNGTSVTLTARPAAGSLFRGWTGACAAAASSNTCTVSVTGALTATATFIQQSFGNVNVCPAGQSTPSPCIGSLAVPFTMAADTTIGAVRVVTQGSIGLDFSMADGGTCNGIVAGGASCVVNVNFAPLAPGLRQGAVQLYDASGNLLATTQVYGVGQAPAIAFGPGTQSTVNPGSYFIYQPKGVGTDAAGNIYIANTSYAQVVKVTPSGAQSLVGSGLQYPQGVAIDGAGNVFIADNNLNRVVEVPAGCTASSCQRILGAGYRSQLGVAVDPAGNVFFGDFLDGKVVRISALDGTQTEVFSGGAGSNPVGVAVDAAGNLYIADYGRHQVIKVTPAGAQSTIGSGWSQVESVSVDAAGDVYVADAGLRSVTEVPAGCNSSACQVTLAGNTTTYGATIDAVGNVYIADTLNNRVLKVNRSAVPSFNFATTNVGATSTDSPHLVSVQNTGNQPLAGAVTATLGGNFIENSSCAGYLPLSPGSICTEALSFRPQATGYFTGAVQFSTNALNVSPAAVQAIQLTGAGGINGQPPAITVPNVVGMTRDQATTALTNAGLTLGTISTAASSTIPQGSTIDSNPPAGTQVALSSAVKLLISSGQPQAPSPNPLLLQNNYFVTGDAYSAGVTLRGLGQGGVATGTITIPSNASGGSAGVPDGADILAAYLYWQTLESTPSASGGAGTFRGYAISGQQIGADLPYTDGSFSGTLRVYRADVNAYLPARPDGVRLASGAHTVSLPDGGGAALPMTEGASLVVIYRVMSPNFPLKAVVIYDGSAAPTSATTQVMKGFYDAAGGGGAIGELTTIASSGGTWNTTSGGTRLGSGSVFGAPLYPGNAYAALVVSTPVNNSDNDGILNAWKDGPPAADFHAGEPGYYDVKTGWWVPLPGAKRGQKDLFVQLDYMCGNVLADGSCDPTQENLFPSPDAQGHDPLDMVKKAFANHGVQLHLTIGNIVPEDTCTDNLAANPPQLCQFPNQKGVISWKNSLMFSKLWPKNFLSCITGGDCTTRFPYGQKDSYHYVLFGHSLAIPAWNARFGTLKSVQVAGGVTTVHTADRGNGINACPSRITLSGVLGNPTLNGIFNTTSCPDTKTIILATPGVPDWTFPNSSMPEPIMGLTSGTITSISGYSDLGGADSAITLGLWATAPNQDMSKRANVTAGTLFHEIGHTLGLSHGGLYYDTPGSYIPTFDPNCKPNYQSVMNYLFQLDLLGPNKTLDFSSQVLNPLNESADGAVTQLTDASGNAAAIPTSAWYVPWTSGITASPATRHCDGTPLNGDESYRVDASVSQTTPLWTNGQDINFDGQLNAQMRGYDDWSGMDLRQVGATGGQFASLSSLLAFGSIAAPVNVASGGNVTLGSGGTVTLGSGGNVTLGSGGNVTLGSGGTVTLGSGGNVTLGSGGTVTLGSGGVITFGSGGNVTLGSGGNVTLGSGGTITLGSGGNVTLGSGGNVTLGSGGTITLGSGGVVTIPSSGGSYTLPAGGGTITLGSGGNVTLGSGGNVTLGSGGTITLGSGGNVTLGSGGNVVLGSGGTITLGSGGNVTLGSGGNVTLGSGGTITLGSGGTVTLGSGGNVTLGSGGTVTLGSGGTSAGGGNVTLGSGGTVTLGSGGTVTLGSGGNVTLGSGGNVTLGSGGTITMGSGGNVTLGSGGNVTLGSGGTITLGSGGNVVLGSGGLVTLGSGGTITLGSGGTVTLGSGGSYLLPAGGGTITLGSGGNVTMGSGGNVTLGSGGTITLGSGGNVTLGSGGNVTLGSGGTITMGSGGTVTLGSGGTVTLGSGGNVTLGSGGNVTLGSGGNITLGSGGLVALGSGGNVTLGSGGNITLGSGGVTSVEMTYDDANSIVRPPALPTYTPSPVGVRIDWTAPAFGVVQTYTIYRSSDGAPPILIGSVSGINGNPPATSFTDDNPDLTSSTVLYTISTTLVPDNTSPDTRQSPPSAPAVLKNDQTIVLDPLPSSVLITDPQPVITATAQSGGVPNGQQVNFSATGSCTVGSQSISNNVSSATVILNATGSCIITASQPGSDTYNSANAVTGSFAILPQGSSLHSQTITFGSLPNVAYGSTFSLSATSSSGLPVSFQATGPCTANGITTGVGQCTITATAPASSTYSAASVSQSFIIAPAVLKVTANNLTSTYGQAIPALTYSYTGFMNGDTPSVVTGTPALSTTATSSSNVGTYPITVATGSLAAANYSFLYVNGTLTIQRASAAINVTPYNVTYNGQAHTATGAVTGVGGVTLTGLTLTGTTHTNAGTYSADAWTFTDSTGNYNDASGTVSDTISPATPTISISNIPAPFALLGGTFTPAYSYSGNVTPVESVTSSTPTVCTVLGSTVSLNGVGTCTLTANSAATTNYTAATGAAQSFLVYQPPTISSANSATIMLGTPATFTVTSTGFPAPRITLAGQLPGGITFTDNGNGTATLSGTATTTAIYPITFTAANAAGTVAQSFTLTAETTILPSGNACNGVYVGTFKGNVTVSSGQTCIFEYPGAVSGNITVTGGKLQLMGITVGGSLQISGGAYSTGPFTTSTGAVQVTTINGNLQVQNVPAGSAQNQICDTTVTGGLQIQASGTAVTIGSGTSSCLGNTIKGNLSVQSNSAPVGMYGNTVSGNLINQSNTAATVLSGNKVGGNLQDQNNSSPTSPATQVTNNTVTKNLLCSGNSTITGSGNTATQKQGQCSTF